MIKAKTIILTGMMAMNSCIPSLFPLYTEVDLVTDDRLVGTWDAGEYGTCVIERLDYTPKHDFFGSDWSEPEDKKSYKLVVFDVDNGDYTITIWRGFSGGLPGHSAPVGGGARR